MTTRCSLARTLRALGASIFFAMLTGVVGCGGGITAPALTPATGVNPTQLGFGTALPTSAVAGQPIPTFTVVVLDAGGEVVTSDTGRLIELFVASGTGTLTGALATTLNGVATFTGVVYDRTEMVVFKARAAGLSESPPSPTVQVAVGLASKLAFGTPPPPAASAGVPLTAFSVRVLDSGGNLVSSDNGRAITLSLVSGTGTLSGASAVTSGGVATFSAVTYDRSEIFAFTATASGLTAPTRVTLAAGAGTPTQILFGKAPPATATSGSDFADFTILVHDAFGNLVTADSGRVVTVGLTSGTGTLTGVTATTSQGVATFRNVTYDIAESITIRGTSSGLTATAISSSIAVSPGAATALAFGTNPPATGSAGTNLATFTVRALDAQGNTVVADSGRTITLALVTGTGALSGLTALTSSGVATFSAVTYDKAETITIAATATGLTDSATSSGIAIGAGAAVMLVFGSDTPTTGTAGQSLASFQVLVQDTFGNTVTSDTGRTITLAVVTGTGSFSGGAVSTVGGVATFSAASYNRAETITFKATAAGLTDSPTSDPLDIDPGAAAMLVFGTSPPSAAVAGAAFASFDVLVQDTLGNTVTADAGRTINVVRVSGTGTLTAVAGTTAAGVATFTAVSYDVAETMTLRATSTGLTSSPASGNVVVSPAAATKLAFGTLPPTTATAGQSFASFTVRVLDAFDNLVTADSGTSVTVELVTGTGTYSGTSATTASGVATFSAVSYNLAQTTTFKATATGLAETPPSASVVVSPGAASALVFGVLPPVTAAAGQNFASFTVLVKDAQGNTVVSDSSTSVSLTRVSGTGTISGGTVTASSGVATFASVSYDVAESMTFTAGAAGLTSTPASDPVVVAAGAASQLVFGIAPPTAVTAGAAFAAFSVIVQDVFGNTVTAGAPLTIVVARGAGTGTLTGNSVATTAGVATFTTVTYNRAESIVLTASSAPLTDSPASASITVSPAAPAKLVFGTAPPTTATAGQAFASFTVEVQDAMDNRVVSDSGRAVTLVLVTGTGTYSGGAASTVSGVATFGAVSYNLAQTTTFKATAAPLAESPPSAGVVVSAGAAAALVFGTLPPTTATAGQAFTSYTVLVQDAQGNTVVADSTTSVVLAVVSGTGTISGGTVTASSGVATFSAMSYNRAESMTFRATAGGLTSSPASAAVAVSPGAPAALVFGVSPPTSGTVGQNLASFTVLVKDAFANTVTADGSTVVTLDLVSGVGTLTGNVATASAGVVTFAAVKYNVAQSMTFRAISGVLTPSATTPSIAIAVALFGTFADTTVGTAPRGVAIGDLNGNGAPDLVSANSGSDNVSVALGNGAGSFPGVTTFGAGSAPSAVAVADFNRDGDLDVVVSNLSTDRVSILLGDGSGALGTPGGFAMGTAPRHVVTGDFNNDGSVDVATANSGSNNVSIRLGNGAGSLGAVANVSVGSEPRCVAVGDLDNDGDLDLVVANGGAGANTVSVLFNNGSGTFSVNSTPGCGPTPVWVAVGDLDRDGDLDLVTANSTGPSASVLLNNGSGGFPSFTDVTAGMAPTSVAIGDLDQDGDLDAALADGTGNVVVALTGNGAGTLTLNSSYAVGTTPVCIVLGDVDRIGGLDVVTASFGIGTMTVGRNTGLPTSGSLGTASNTTVQTTPVGAAVGDFDGDGDLDVAVVNQGSDSLSVLVGNGAGGFAAAANLALGVGTAPRGIAVGDFDHDGDPDLVVSCSGTDEVKFMENNGAGTFTETTTTAVGVTPVAIMVADFNRDGDLDYAVTKIGDDDVSLVLGNGAGTFGSPTDFVVGTDPLGVAAGDLNRDGHLDLIVANSGTNDLFVFISDGLGSFAAPVTVATGTTPSGVVIGDFDRDGDLDVAVSNLADDTASVMLGDGAGALAAGTPFSTGDGPSGIIAADLDRDGDLDLAVVNFNTTTVSLLLGVNDGTFGTKTDFTVGTAPIGVATGDFDRNGLIDVIVTNSGSTSISRLLGAP